MFSSRAGARRRSWRTTAAACVLCWSEAALAEPPAEADFRTFRYDGAAGAEPRTWRVAIEGLGLIGAGLADYWHQKDVNSIDWDLDYSWATLENKLTGGDQAFDTNLFNTNFARHPAGGTLYYLAARGNRFGPLTSLGFAIASSTVWEVLGEFRERVSTNDLFVTPLSGFAFGEATTQLGALFDRSCDSQANLVLGSVFGPVKSLHDALDGLEPERAESCDARGFARDGAYRFSFSAGSGAVAAPATPTVSFLRVRTELDLVHVPTLGKPGRSTEFFDDGNVASLDVDLSFSGSRWADFRVFAATMPAGVHYRDIVKLPRARIVGHELLVGPVVAAEYSAHRYGEKSARMDRVFALDVPAVEARYRLYRPLYEVEIACSLGTTLAGIDAFALDEYSAVASRAELTSVAAAQGYNHAFGFSARPRARLTLAGVEVGVEARADRLFAIRALDRSQGFTSPVPVEERRRRAELWLAVGPRSRGMRFLLSTSAAQRSGSIGAVTAGTSELGVGAAIAALL